MGIERRSAAELAAGIASGRLSAASVVEACLARIAEREPVVGAWAHLDVARAREEARRRDAGPRLGPLHGLPVGVKDIIDTAALPTGYGSPLYAGSRPGRNAAIVDRLERSGAIILGKTVTTEFAFRFPGRTTNPHDARHTPGGSSSGSAAAVADFMVPLALGTQTTGSVIRPAGFCGIVGYKPTFGEFERDGVRLLAPSLDTVGLHCRSVDDLELVAGALTTRPARPPDRLAGRPPRLVVCRTPAWPQAEEASRSALARVASALSASGALVTDDGSLEGELLGLAETHNVICAFEMARSLAREYRDHRERLSAPLVGFLDHGREVTEDAFRGAVARAASARVSVDAALGDHDAVLTVSAPGEAPVGLESTGNAIFNGVWTLLHFPCVTLPLATGPHGLPVGIQIVARGGDDRTALAVAAWIWARRG